MAQQAGFEATMQTPAKPSFQSSTHGLKGISKQRMRVAGKRVQSKAEIEKAIIELLKAPMTTGQLAAAMTRTPKTLRRDYLAPMVKDGKIQQQGDYYARKGATERHVQKEQFDDIVKRSAFMQLPVMQDLVTHCRTLRRGATWPTQIWSICTGRSVPTFKCRPEHWTQQTTIEFIEAWRQYKQKDRLESHIRQALRYIHEFILREPVTKAQKSLWGVDGTKDNPGQYRFVKLSLQQIHALCKFYLDQGDLEFAAYSGFGIETFGRPVAVFGASPTSFKLVEKTYKAAIVEGAEDEPIYDSKVIQVLKILSASSGKALPLKFETQTAQTYEGQMYESKTDRTWPKRVVDALHVTTLQEYLKGRSSKGRIFGRDGESFQQWQERAGLRLKQGYDAVGGTDAYFTMRPMYALRHIGAHLWLDRLDGDYSALSEMAWEDPNIPKKFYAGYDQMLLDKKLARKW